MDILRGMQTETALQQLTWNCKAGWSYEVPGAHEVFGTYEEARRAIEQWVSGLDIDPGESVKRAVFEWFAMNRPR